MIFWFIIKMTWWLSLGGRGLSGGEEVGGGRAREDLATCQSKSCLQVSCYLANIYLLLVSGVMMLYITALLSVTWPIFTCYSLCVSFINYFNCLFGQYQAIRNNIVAKKTTELFLLFYTNITKLVFLWSNKQMFINAKC